MPDKKQKGHFTMKKICLFIIIAVIITSLGCGKKSVSIKEGWNNDHTIYTNLYGVHITQEEYDNICKTYKDEKQIRSMTQNMVWDALHKMTMVNVYSYFATKPQSLKKTVINIEGEKISIDDKVAYKYDIVDCDKYDLIIFVEQDDTITGLRLANDDGVFCNMEYGSDNAENAFEKVDELFRSIYSEAETHIFEGENK